MAQLSFDIQAHRGGAGLAVENTLSAFGGALELGVTTLECDVHISADGVPMVNHDRTYADRVIPTLTRAELAGLDNGTGTWIPTLDEVLALVDERGAAEVGLNIETKFDVVHPDEEAPRETFVEVVVATLRTAGMCQRASIQSFDWTMLTLIGAEEPLLARNALVNAAHLEAHRPGASPWLGGLDIDDFAGSVVAAASRLGFDAVSPSQAILTPAMITEAHRAELRVLPYTVDDPPTMRHLVGLGVDGLITNRPDLLRSVLDEEGIRLPTRYPVAG